MTPQRYWPGGWGAYGGSRHSEFADGSYRHPKILYGTLYIAPGLVLTDANTEFIERKKEEGFQFSYEEPTAGGKKTKKKRKKKPKRKKNPKGKTLKAKAKELIRTRRRRKKKKSD